LSLSTTELALGDARLVAMRRFVRTHLGNPELRPVMVAAEFGISLRYLHRLFAVTGQSFSEFVFGERLEFCRDKLSSPGCAHQSISDIAMEAGFQSFSHFSRRFRAAFNQSPRDYRNAAGR